MKHTTLKLCTLAIAVASSQAFAHTIVRDVADEGTASNNAFVITHGCGAERGTQSYPVLGQSAAFPYGNNAVWRNSDGSIIPADQDEEGNDRNNGAGTIEDLTLSLGLAGVGGFQSSFATTQEIVGPSDADPQTRVVQGILWKDGAMAPNLYTNTPFRVNAPLITDHCVKTLKVRIAVINYCDIAKNATNDANGPYVQPKDAFGRTIPMAALAGAQQTNVTPGTPVFSTMPAGNGDNNRADWWFPALEGSSALYNDPQMLQTSFWTELEINNSAVDTALCPGGEADLKEVTVEPNAIAVDRILSGPNTRPFTRGNTNL